MKFVVATHSYLLLVSVSDDLKLTDIKVLDSDYYDGVDVMRDGTIIACAKADHWSKSSPSVFKWFDTNGRLNIPSMDGSNILDPHQISLSDDQRGLWTCSTATNELVYKSLRNSDLDYKVSFHTPHGGDWNHINSICVRGNNLYVVFHNLAREPSDIRKFKLYDSKIDQGDDLMELVYTQLLPHFSIHNFEIDGLTYYYNASDNGRIMCGSWGTDDFGECEIGREWHPKGMTLTRDYIVSGWSEHAVSTPRRFVSQSGLIFVDRQKFEVAKQLTIELDDGSFCGNVNEVRVLD